MADATAPPSSTAASTHAGRHPHDHHAPVTPGKVAMWLFLATEVMFFTGLIGSYIVLRAGSPSTYYTNLYVPTSNYAEVANTYGVVLRSTGSNPAQAEEAIRAVAPELSARAAREIVEEAGEVTVVNKLTKEKAENLAAQLQSLGVTAHAEPVIPHNWPKPYDELTNPLSINLTAFNTFVLICSSVTMVLSLSAMQQGKRGRSLGFLAATIVIGSFFLSIQVYEYYELMFGRHYPPGISATGHFRPNVSLFASCFFTMTGFHGMHVTGGVIALIMIFIQSLRGVFTQTHYNPIEFVGLYWHFVDLVWIILFTIVYLI